MPRRVETHPEKPNHTKASTTERLPKTEDGKNAGVDVVTAP
jgi:hypothetical protein